MHNLLDTDFANRNRWLFNQYLVAALRVDKKVLPSRLFQAHLDKRAEAWCRENRRQVCPASVRTDLKDALEGEMLIRILPRVQVYEFCWNIVDGWVLLHNTSDRANELFRKQFHATFGHALAPFSPLDFIEDDPDLSGALEIQGTTDLSRGGTL